MKYTTVALKPGIDVEAGEQIATYMACGGRVFFAAKADQVAVYVRNNDGDYECVFTTDLGDGTPVITRGGTPYGQREERQ